ncbi:MAG: glycoside hydrolase family 57 protein [Planctomycetota bacterium]
MTDVVFYFQVHQPFRLQRGATSVETLFDDALNKFVLERVAERCYLPTNQVLLDAIEATGGRFRCSFSVSGVALEQMELWAPEVLDSFRALLATGSVEMLCETSQHSLAALVDEVEFAAQVEKQRATLKRLFDVTPTSFRNTELIVDEPIARQVEALGFQKLMGEGADQLLDWRVPYVPYRVRGTSRLSLLLRAYSYSDDIAFRFSNRAWPAYPLMADTFAEWLDRVPHEAPFIGLFMDYETFGEHQPKDTGILDFLGALPEFVLAKPRFRFRTPAEIDTEPVGELAYPRTFSWADAERDVSAWLGNPMQRAAFDAIWSIAGKARAAADAGAPELLEAWRKLTTSDHTYYISTKFAAASDGDVHEYFSPYDSPHAAYLVAMNAIGILERRLRELAPSTSSHSAP